MASTAETNLLKPARGTVPSPLRVSTTDELEYGTVVLRFGRELSSAPKVYCKGITLKVPTGPSATDLTVEPSLITTAVSKVEGEAQGTEWWVDRNTTDPNEAVFSFVPDTTAVFDGTWAVSLTLSGIEVNPSIGTVDLKIEELTSTTGADESYQKRTGQVTVKKGNDEFYFRSLRPRTTVIERGLTVDLLWDAPADNRIQYTMYYRKADGTETHDSVQSNFAGRVWKSPTLVDHTNFTLKATIDGKDYFLTTSLTVNKPDVVVNKLSANSDITMAAAGDAHHERARPGQQRRHDQSGQDPQHRRRHDRQGQDPQGHLGGSDRRHRHDHRARARGDFRRQEADRGCRDRQRPDHGE